MLTQSALPAVILLSGFGALIMCLLVLEYGFAPLREGPDGHQDRRVLLTRMGHAAAGACFAIVAMLAVVALVEQRRHAPSRQVSDADVLELRQHLAVMEERLGRVESAGLKQLEVSGPALLPSRAATRGNRAVVTDSGRPTIASVERPAVRQVRRAPATVPHTASDERDASPRTEQAETASSQTAPATPPKETNAAQPIERPPAAEPDLATHVRSGWAALKRDASATGDEIKNAFQRLRDWAAP